MNETLLIPLFLGLLWLGLFIGALLPVFLPARSKRPVLALRVVGFLLFAPPMWLWSCATQGGLQNGAAQWEMFTSAVITAMFYLFALAAMGFLRLVLLGLVRLVRRKTPPPTPTPTP